MSVTAPKGFRASGVAAGLKSTGAKDMALVVNDGPGFYTTRILSAYMNEAGRLLDEGVTIDALDSALVQFGFPVGPITLMDEVGLDVAGKVGAVMAESFGARMMPASTRPMRTGPAAVPKSVNVIR